MNFQRHIFSNFYFHWYYVRLDLQNAPKCSRVIKINIRTYDTKYLIITTNLTIKNYVQLQLITISFLLYLKMPYFMSPNFRLGSG